MAVDYTLIIAYGVGVLLLILLGRIFLVPMRVFLRLLYNALIGGVVLVAVNFVGNYFDYHLPFNLLTAFIVGILGIPGILLLVVLKLVFGA